MYSKKQKLKTFFWLIIYIINLILFLLFITLSYIYDKEPLAEKLITFIFIIIILITISFLIINVLLKTKKLTLNDFVTNEKTGAVFLKKEARNIFVNEFGELLKKETGNIIGISNKIRYRRAIEYQVHLLIKALESNCPNEYIPFEIQ